MRLLYNKEFDDFINENLIISRPKCPIGINGNFKIILNKHPEIKEYLENLYDDSSCLEESLYRFSHNIDIVPKCKICGDPIKFDKKAKFRETCSNKECISQNSVNKVQKTKLERYGDSTYNNRDKMYETKIKNHGDANYVNPEKMKATKLQRYGSSSYVNPEKMKATKLQRYGSSSYVNVEKSKKTSIERYGVEFPMQCYEIQQRSYQNNLNNHGGTYFTNTEKGKQTKIEKYGTSNNYSQIRKALLLKYGYECVFQIPKIANKIANSKLRKQHEYETKKKNHSFNSSKTEAESLNLLKEKYQDVIQQYKSESYPYSCDFYIPSKDLYIECNFHWTHGNHPYDENSIEDQKIVNMWMLQKTQFYKNAISTWTIRDVNKRKTAKQNNLNYIEFFSLEELKNWINEEKPKS